MSILTKNPAVGIISFIIILFSMALGHTGMILMETVFGKDMTSSSSKFNDSP